jgi:hypothetical protein
MPIAPFVLAAFLAQAPGPAIAAVVEPRFESLRYRFENPSSFDTAQLVPHFFEQRYDTDHLWLGARLRLRVRNIETEAGAGFTPQTTGRADDLDTFFNPDGNTILSGTIGDASLRAWRAEGRVVIGRSPSVRYGIGYSYRRDTARYHDGTKIVQTSRPPAETRELVTTREFVTSHIHQAQWFARWKRERSWLAATLEASPFALGRLAIELPDKYPGRTLRFSGRAALLAAEATAERAIGGVALELGVRAERSFSYSSAARLRMQGVSFVLRAGTR